MTDESKTKNDEIVIQCSPYSDSETEIVKLEDSYKIKDMLDVFSPEDISIQQGIQTIIIACIAIVASFFAIYVLSNLANNGLSFGPSVTGMVTSVKFPSGPSYFSIYRMICLTVMITMFVLGLLNYLNIIDFDYLTKVSRDESGKFGYDAEDSTKGFFYDVGDSISNFFYMFEAEIGGFFYSLSLIIIIIFIISLLAFNVKNIRNAGVYVKGKFKKKDGESDESES